MPNKQIEQAFADMAVSIVSEKAPALFDHYLGFEVVTQNEDGTRAGGLLGFQVGRELLYVPALYLNGRIKGMVMIYVKNSDVFTSLSKPWIEYLTSQNHGIQGTPTSLNPKTVNNPASLRIFSQPPQAQLKQASVEDRDEIFQEFIGPEKAMAPGMTLPEFFKKAGANTLHRFLEHAIENPETFEMLGNFYDLEDFKISEFEPKSAEYDLADKTVVDVDASTTGSEKGEKPATKKVQVVTSTDLLHCDGEIPVEIDNKTKEKVIRNGFAIVDSRKETEKVAVMREEITSQFSNPTDNGFYEMINQFGQIVPVFIAVHPFLLNSRTAAPGNLVVDPDSGIFVSTPESINVRSKYNVKESEVYSRAIKISEVVPNKRYILVDETLRHISVPFEVRNTVKSEGTTTISATQEVPGNYCETRNLVPFRGESVQDVSDYSARSGRSQYPLGAEPEYNSVILKELTDIESNEVRTVNGTAFIPSNWRFLEVRNWFFGENKDKNTKQMITPGTASQLTAELYNQGFENLVMEKSAAHNDFVISFMKRNSPWLSKQAATIELVTRYGLSVPDAEVMVENTAKNLRDKVMVKAADIYNGFAFPDVEVGFGQTKGGTPEETLGETDQIVPMSNPIPPNPFDNNLANWDYISAQDASLLRKATDVGAQQVFDPGMIGAVLKTSRAMSQVQDILPDLVTGLDKMCRLLLMFYWHNSEFAQSYGKDEMAEFEEVLLDGIKRTGTIVLFLKQQAQESESTKIDALSE